MPKQPQVEKLTPNQERLLHEIEAFIAREGMSPTLRELADKIEQSFQGVSKALRQLEEKGYVRRLAGKSRSLVVLRSVSEFPTVGLVAIPLLRTITSGVQIFSKKNILEEILVDAATVQKGQFFAVTMTDSSMSNADIHSSDILIVRRQLLAEHRDIVVSFVNGEATVRRLIFQCGEISLLSEDKRSKSITVNPEDEFRIVGKVIGVRHPGN